MADFFTNLIAAQQTAGLVGKEEAESLLKLFSVIPVDDKAILERALESNPSLISLVIENIRAKSAAIDSGSMDAWKAVVEDELQQLDELE